MRVSDWLFPELREFDAETRNQLKREGMEQARASIGYRSITVACVALFLLVWSGVAGLPNWIALAVIPGVMWQLMLARAAIRKAAIARAAAPAA